MRRLAIAAVLLACLPAGVAAARQFVQQGTLRVAFDAHLLPHALPREREAPVTVQLAGAVRTTDGSIPPQLREISIAMNRAGVVSVAGLPSCRPSELQQTSTEAALRQCRSALVGHGHFAANVNFPGSPVFPARGTVLVFNSTGKGGMNLLLHLYGSSPVRAAFVLPFKISRQSKGKFGTVFSTHLPRLASDQGYVTDIDLKIGRTYSYRGEKRSFISASCAAPAGFPGAIFELAKATFSFAGGQHLISHLPGDCRVR
ncbi:MAG: hypothetical protein QOF85_1626 [Solirubrobacterales bacterium]|jgi:hypothetical protein|nr:hypothetical protein [Solirubrobacterales bacterium]